ncbi:hypothetical protein Zmor_015046 [Zophobas morio]|uniref:HTH CENPB-type domain-containing protein n=1 Tax=Zophobas morio TaxID=2755281 RepID=A0AA38IJ80_9CUCU|nr:hypothetical protein Zmor_015046 [Zophobas morio]
MTACLKIKHLKYLGCLDPRFSSEEEHTLVEWILTCQRRGFPRRVDDVLTSVQKFIKNSNRETPFSNGKPGKGWYRAFNRRHPELCMRTPEAVTQASACVSANDIRNWFKNIEEELSRNDYRSILHDSSRVYNGDETNFLLCPKNQKVIALRGTKNVYELDQAPAKSAITVMFTFGANGWQKGVLEWRQMHPHFQFNKEQFAPLLEKVVEKYVQPTTIISGFRTTGLFPWDAEALDYSKCLGKQLDKQSEHVAADPVHHEENNRLLDFAKFKQILGSHLTEKLQTKSESISSAEQQCLHRIWEYFRGEDSSSNNILSFDIARMPVDILGINISNNFENQAIIHNINENISENIEEPVLSELESGNDTEQQTSCHVIAEDIELAEALKEYSKTDNFENISACANDPSTLIESDSNCLPIAQTLFWPEPQQRKNKRKRNILRTGLRNGLKRDEKHTFDELLTRARAVEEVLLEEGGEPKPKATERHTDKTGACGQRMPKAKEGPKQTDDARTMDVWSSVLRV